MVDRWQYVAQERVQQVLKKELGLDCIVRLFNNNNDDKVQYWVLDKINNQRISGEFKYQFGKDPSWIFEDKILRKARLEDWDNSAIREFSHLENSYVEAIEKVAEAKGYVIGVVPWNKGYVVSLNNALFYSSSLSEVEGLARKGGR